MAICLARGILELAPIDCWARAGLGPRANKLERGSHNGPCQHQCPHRRMNSKNGYCQCLCPRGEPQLPSASWEAVHNQQVSLTQPPIQLLLCPRVCESLCVPSKCGISFPPKSCWKSCTQVLLDFKPNALGIPPPDARPSGWGS